MNFESFFKGLQELLAHPFFYLDFCLTFPFDFFFNLFFYDVFHSLTLGIGNSVYGLTVLFLTVSFFKIWDFIIPRISLLFLGSIFYFCLMNFILPSFTTNIPLIYSFFLTTFFWFSWIFSFPLLRRDFLVSFSLFFQRSIWIRKTS